MHPSPGDIRIRLRQRVCRTCVSGTHHQFICALRRIRRYLDILDIRPGQARPCGLRFQYIVIFMLSIAWLSLLIWIVLLLARGGFWRAQPAPALSSTTIHALGNVEIARHGAWPGLVAVVPARNEADVIGHAVGSLLKQDYEGAFHVIVDDDYSTDGTAAAALAAARDLGLEDRLTVLTAQPLPPGWSGKVWAQSQSIEAIDKLGLPAEFLLLTDADIHRAPLGAGRGGRHRIDPARTDRRLQSRAAHQASRRRERCAADPPRSGGRERIAAPL